MASSARMYANVKSLLCLKYWLWHTCTNLPLCIERHWWQCTLANSRHHPVNFPVFHLLFSLFIYIYYIHFYWLLDQASGCSFSSSHWPTALELWLHDGLVYTHLLIISSSIILFPLLPQYRAVGQRNFYLRLTFLQKILFLSVSNHVFFYCLTTVMETPEDCMGCSETSFVCNPRSFKKPLKLAMTQECVTLLSTWLHN